MLCQDAYAVEGELLLLLLADQSTAFCRDLRHRQPQQAIRIQR